jgi:hypothetical protein
MVGCFAAVHLAVSFVHQMGSKVTSTAAMVRAFGSCALALAAVFGHVSPAQAQTPAPATLEPGAAPDPALPAPPADPSAPATAPPSQAAPSDPALPAAPIDPALTQPAPTALTPAEAPAGEAPVRQLAGGPSTGMEDAPPAEDVEKKPRQFGVMFDLGVPDGTVLSFVYRPVRVARFHAGLGYNGVSPGLRIGAALLPFGWGPSLSADYGHYFEGDANGLAEMFAGSTGEEGVLLEKVGYDYVNLRAGMEFGGDRFTFFFRGGFTWVRTTIHEFNALLEADGEANNTTIDVKQDPVLTALAPSLQLGFIVQL